MSNTYFFTGFPGFIASELVTNLIRKYKNIERIYLLTLPDLVQQAQDARQRISRETGCPLDRLEVVPGDITQKHLALAPDLNERLRNTVTHVFHLAAIYDLAVPRDIAQLVNVDGTRMVNDWVRALERIERYIYFSTAYVSGMREGKILETELQMGQAFKNHYESTKYEAEVLVQGIREAVPTTIIRPGIVRGHSRTGETIKFDGPYFILNFLDRLRFLPIIPHLGKGAAEGNFVPVDYVFDAALYLGHDPIGAGKTYHLTDPHPCSMRDVYTMLTEAFLHRKPAGTVPLWAAKALMSVPAFRKYARVEKEGLDYFTCLAMYDCSQAQQDLADSGVVCPDFRSTVDAMAAFYKEHKEDMWRHLLVFR